MRTGGVGRIAIVAALVGGLAACSSGGGISESDSGAGGNTSQDEAAGRAAPQQASGAEVGAAADSVAAVVPAERALVYIADLAVRVHDVDDAVSRTEQVTATAGGTVANAERTGETTATGTARLVLRVPPDQFWPMIRALEDLGTRVQLTQSSQDVTAEVADVESRVTSARRIIETFRSRLDQATTITDILALETEIARREAELEALQARQRALEDSVDLSTVTVTFTADAEPLPADDNLGFLLGLEAGWRGLQSATAVALTIIGGLLPFTVLALLIAVPLWLLLRRRSQPRGAS
jgi:Domain of unknown function (DUF4349)